MVPEIRLERIENFIQSINVYKDGGMITYLKGEEKFNKIVVTWQGMLVDSHLMPAFGVSLNNETCAAMARGVWVEFDFGQPLSTEGMYYEKLLINVVPDVTGFNVIRYNPGVGYDGRCFYFDLIGHDMSDFYNCIIN